MFYFCKPWNVLSGFYKSQVKFDWEWKIKWGSSDECNHGIWLAWICVFSCSDPNYSPELNVAWSLCNLACLKFHRIFLSLDLKDYHILPFS